jgi:ABC-type polysaccharide/polyol phosphate export permease
LSAVSELYRARELVLNLIRRELKGNYRGTAFGQLWSLVNPLTVMAVYTVVFSLILRVQPAPGDPSGLKVYALWLLCGLLPWTFFTGVVNGGMRTLIGNGDLIQKVAFPRSALIVSNSISLFVTWCIEMSVLVAALLIAGADVLIWLPFVLLLMASFWLFATGLAMMLSIANVHFRDTEHFVGVLLQVWFYLTPILYPISFVEAKSQQYGPIVGSVSILDVYELNPMAQFATAFRSLLYDNRFPEIGNVLVCFLLSLIVAVAGLFIFKRYEKGLAEAL